MIDFTKGRLRQLSTTKNIHHDVVDAVLNAEQKGLVKVFAAAQLLKQHLADEDSKPSVEALTHVANLMRKAQLEKRSEVDPKLPENDAEGKPRGTVETVKASLASQMIHENYDQLVIPRPLVENYFDQAMVMVDESAMHRNRLIQLSQIAVMVLSLASLDQVITKQSSV